MRTSIRSTNISSAWNSPSDGSVCWLEGEWCSFTCAWARCPQQVWDLVSAYLAKNLGPDDPVPVIPQGL